VKNTLLATPTGPLPPVPGAHVNLMLSRQDEDQAIIAEERAPDYL
jgi:hypothetical protein